MRTDLPFEPYKDIEAQLRTWEIDQLVEQVKKVKPYGCFVEIGTKYGGTAYLVRYNINETCGVYSIDPNPQLYMFKGKENEVGINWIKGCSVDVAKEWEKLINLLFIDGDHGEGTITAPWDDFMAWEKFVPSGGVIMMHDYHFDFPEVVKACDKILETGRYKLLFKPPELANRQDTSMFIVQKL